MSRVFKTANEYILFLKNLPFNDGEIVCTSFLPSALFQKDIIAFFFKKRVALDDAQSASQMLWDYGKQLRRAVSEGIAHLYIEERAIAQFCEKGIVHDAYPDYEVGFSTRAIVLNTLKNITETGNVAVVKGPLPYIFRLHRPTGVLIDVINNTLEQTIQGIWIEEKGIVDAFFNEAQRLFEATPVDGKGENLVKKLEGAIGELKAGYPVEWRKGT